MAVTASGKLDPELQAWRLQAQPGERGSVLIRIAYSQDPGRAREALEDLGADVQSAGPGTIVAVVSVRSMGAIATLPFVVAIQSPHELRAAFTRTL